MRLVSDEEADVRRILDKLGITPQYLRDFPHDIGREAVSTVDTIAGPVYCKGGGLRTPGGQGVASMICLMPGDIEFAILANSWDGTKDGPLRMIPDLINNSTKFSLFFW